MQIKQAILNAIDRIGRSPIEINSGLCGDLTQLVCDAVEDADWATTEQIEDKLEDEGYHWIGHVWVVYQDKHYDAECIDGVDNFLDLPIFQRVKLH